MRETARLCAVLDRRLADREFVAGDDYSIADMAIYPWIVPHEAHRQDLDATPHVKRWFLQVGQRPATRRVYADAAASYAKPLTDAERAMLFGTPPAR